MAASCNDSLMQIFQRNSSRKNKTLITHRCKFFHLFLRKNPQKTQKIQQSRGKHSFRKPSQVILIDISAVWHQSYASCYSIYRCYCKLNLFHSPIHYFVGCDSFLPIFIFPSRDTFLVVCFAVNFRFTLIYELRGRFMVIFTLFSRSNMVSFVYVSFSFVNSL